MRIREELKDIRKRYRERKSRFDEDNWKTIKGTHVLVDEEGEIKGKVGERIMGTSPKAKKMKKQRSPFSFSEGVKKKLGTKFTESMDAALKACPNKNIRRAFAKHSHTFVYAEQGKHPDGTEYHSLGARGTHYDPVDKCVRFANPEAVALGDDYHKPMQTAFHEFMHYTDYLNGDGKLPFSYGYKNHALADSIDEEGEKFAELYLKHKWNLPYILIKDYDIDDEALEAMDTETLMLLSDTIEAYVGIEYPLKYGHGLDYWGEPKSRRRQEMESTEFMAKYAEAMLRNDAAGKILRTVFPKSFALAGEIVDKMADYED